MADVSDSTAYLLRELAEAKHKVELLQKRLHRAKRRARPRAKPVPPQHREWTVDQWRQHELILKRIRSFPNRDIL